jgi:butyrate kinase
MKILVINPGSSSTKVALFEDRDRISQENLSHPAEELDRYETLMDQRELRERAIMDFLATNRVSLDQLDAIAARGGILPPLESGTYLANQAMEDFLLHHARVQHASNLAAVIGLDMARKASKPIPVYVTDPVSVDEMDPVARISGIKDLERKCLSHISNMRVVGIKVAEEELKRPFNETNMVIAHLGGGISVAPFERGRMFDVNNANDEGPFSVERSGELPVGDVVKVAYSGQYTKDQLKKTFVGKGGLVAYLGTNDLREAFKVAQEDPKALEVIEAMAYQIAQEIGAMCVALKGRVDCIVITGGMAHSDRFVQMIQSRVGRFARVFTVPGEMEMEALAYGALRVMTGQEAAKEFTFSAGGSN